MSFCSSAFSCLFFCLLLIILCTILFLFKIFNQILHHVKKLSCMEKGEEINNMKHNQDADRQTPINFLVFISKFSVTSLLKAITL